MVIEFVPRFKVRWAPAWVALALAVPMCSMPTANAQNCAPTSQLNEKRILFGGIKLDDVPHAEQSSGWYWIPSWFAGTWHRKSVTTIHTHTDTAKQHAEGASRRTETSIASDEEGWQRDNQGECWNYIHTPFISEAQGDSTKQYFLVTTLAPLIITHDRVVKEFVGTGVVVDTSSGEVKHMARARSIQTYKLVKPGVIYCTSILTELDSAGRAVGSHKSAMTYHKTHDFQARDRDGNSDLRRSFKEFLARKGLEELIPVGLAATNATAE